MKSEPGKGSEFYMTLCFPLGEEEEKLENTEVKQQRSLAGMRILLAEDNEINAEIAQELLATQGIAAVSYTHLTGTCAFSGSCL